MTEEWSNVTMGPNKGGQGFTPSVVPSSVPTAGRDQNKTNPSKKFPSQRGFWESFTCHQPCRFLKSNRKILYASQGKSPSEKRAWEMDRDEKLCQKGKRWRTSLSRLKLLCPWTLYGSPLEQSWGLWWGSPLPCSRYRVSWERKAGNVHLTCRMTKVRTQQPTVGTLRFPVLLPPQETSGRWHCALSQRSHCCGPSETPPSQLWICQADQHHSRNNHLSEGWQLSNGKRERRKREWVSNHWSFYCFGRVHDLPWCEWLPHTPIRWFKTTSLSKRRHWGYGALLNHQLVLVWCSPLSINSHQSPSSEELWGLGLLTMRFPHSRRTNTRPAPTNPANPLWAQQTICHSALMTHGSLVSRGAEAQ